MPKLDYLRLSGAYQGQVELYYRGSWGGICCSSWNKIAANVVCKTLGFPRALDTMNAQSDLWSDSNSTQWLDNVLCKVADASISSCSDDGWRNGSCDPSSVAGVVCGEFMQAARSSKTTRPNFFRSRTIERGLQRDRRSVLHGRMGWN